MVKLLTQTQAHSAAQPLVFSNTCGHFMPGVNLAEDRGLAVLFVSSWGFEEMSSRRFFRNVAEALSDRNISSLRFDYPGTGDSLDLLDDDAGLQIWRDALKAASMELYKRCRYTRLVVFAQGFGALLASEVLSALPGLHACVLVNPVLAGRHYLREVAVWSSVIANNLEIPEGERDKSSGSIAGLQMPAKIASEVKNCTFRQISGEKPVKVLVAVPNAASWTNAKSLVSEDKQEIEILDFPGFREMIANVTTSKVPVDTVRTIADWINGCKGNDVRPSNVLPMMTEQPQLKGAGFVETPVRFGHSKSLSGMVCRAKEPTGKTVVLFLTTAYERHSSWGRMHTELARSLARVGIASLRFDAASVGDSASRPGAPEQVLYTNWLEMDVLEAVDYLIGLGFEKIVVAARCSGGYVAFQSALRDDRIKGLVTVNQDAFFWPEGKPVDELLKFVPKDFHKYATKLFDFGTLKRIVRGEIQLFAAIRNISSECFRRCANIMAPVFIFDRAQSDAIQKTKAGFKALAKRKVPISLLYAEGDLGLRAIEEVFGKSVEPVIGYDNVKFHTLMNCDHNLSNRLARKAYLDEIISVVNIVSARDDMKPVAVHKKSPEIAKAVFSLATTAFIVVQSKFGTLFEYS